MKKIALVCLAVLGLFTACKKEELTVTPASLVMYVADEVQLEAKVGADKVAAVWASADEKIATVENGLVKAIAVGTTTITATYEGQTANVPVTVEELVEDMPEIAAPGAGKVTIALQAPAGTCNGVILVGAGVNDDGSDDWNPANQAHKFEAVEGTQTWYAITLNYKEGIGAKAIAVSEAGAADWGTQWGMNEEGKEPNVVLLTENATLDNKENGGEVKLTELTDGEVVYVQVVAWKSEPCTPKNEAGTATFEMTAPALPEGFEVYVVGNFSADDNWVWAGEVAPTHKMAFADGKYTLTADVPAAFEYKYFYTTADGTMSWDNSENSGNRQMSLDLKAVDTVTEWKGAAVTPAE